MNVRAFGTLCILLAFTAAADADECSRFRETLDELFIAAKAVEIARDSLLNNEPTLESGIEAIDAFSAARLVATNASGAATRAAVANGSLEPLEVATLKAAAATVLTSLEANEAADALRKASLEYTAISERTAITISLATSRLNDAATATYFEIAYLAACEE